MADSKYEDVRDASLARLQFVGEREYALQIEIRDWRRTYPFTLNPVIDDDGQGWKAVLRIKSQPPLARWGLAATEIMNHLRSVLNTTLSRLVAADGLVLRKPRALQFPAAATFADWGSEKSRVAELPHDVQRAIFAMQPFAQAAAYPAFAGQDAITTLFKLDNQGKHGLELVAQPGASEFQYGLRAILRDAPPQRPSFRRTSHKPRWVDGAVFVEERTSPFHVLDFDGAFDWMMDIVVRSDSGHEVELTEQLTELHNFVTATVHVLIDTWSGNAGTDLLPPLGAADFADYMRPVAGSAFRRSEPDTSRHGIELERPWAPNSSLP